MGGSASSAVGGLLMHRDAGVGAHRYSLTSKRDAAVRRVRPANSRTIGERERESVCVRRRARRAGSPAAAALGRGFSRRRGTRRCPAGRGEKAEGAPGSRGGAPLPSFPPRCSQSVPERVRQRLSTGLEVCAVPRVAGRRSFCSRRIPGSDEAPLSESACFPGEQRAQRVKWHAAPR